MKFEDYLGSLEKKLESYYDIEKNIDYRGIKIDLLATFHVKSERYILTKKAKIFGIENNEYCFIKSFSELDTQGYEQYTDLLKDAIIDYVNPHEEHMSSLITGVLVVDNSCNQDFINRIEKFKFHKSFAFGFKGWVDIALVLVLLDKGEVITNKKGKEVSKAYQIS